MKGILLQVGQRQEVGYHFSLGDEGEQSLGIQAARALCTITFVKEPGYDVEWAKQRAVFVKVRVKAGRRLVSPLLGVFESGTWG